ncbi:FGGY-family carbohydrate kinase [Pseudoflavonifractor phocaeensis]|uniref:FGGY-family carbohydrate kinase n=1 Tax=Pseudoflavonifractor phocaeensis TaxID=1870988 RepID=UPI001FAE827D|nr:FGGY-family carbohydrate kinase [Pseudoflavonifractor phocaeensis]
MGISGGVKKAHLVRSVVEAIAFANAHVIEDIGKWFHVEKPETVKISGGVAQEELLGQLIANVVGTKVEKPVSLEASAIGAAEFAGIYTGIYTLEDIPRLLTVEKVYEPDANAQKDAETYEKWKKVIERTTKWEF